MDGRRQIYPSLCAEYFLVLKGSVDDCMAKVVAPGPGLGTSFGTEGECIKKRLIKQVTAWRDGGVGICGRGG